MKSLIQSQTRAGIVEALSVIPSPIAVHSIGGILCGSSVFIKLGSRHALLFAFLFTLVFALLFAFLFVLLLFQCLLVGSTNLALLMVSLVVCVIVPSFDFECCGL